VIFTQDGHLRAIVEFLSDAGSWRELGTPQPRIGGLGQYKLLRLDFDAGVAAAQERSAASV
jgi:hypothetical protein